MAYNSRVRRSPQRIALNAQLLQLSGGYRSAGIARYIFQLLRALPPIASDLELHAFTQEPRATEILPGIRVHRPDLQTQSPIVRILWEQFVFPYRLASMHFDLCHSMAFVSPQATTTPCIVTVYDLAFLLFPEYFRPLNRIYLKWGTRLSTVRARRVIAISESTKRDLVRLFHLEEEKIDVIPPGVESEFFPNGDGNVVERFRRSKNLPDHMLLFVGTFEPRKNIPTLIRAFARAKSRARLPHCLALVGGKGWKEEAIARAVEASGTASQVLVPGFVPAEEIPYWYRAADAFVYPSRYEGFGMPVLEAMAAGTPVITSNLSSLPEAAGDAAVLVDPENEDALEDAIVHVLGSRELQDDLRSKGRNRAHQFTWARAAEATADVYRRALE